MAKYHVDTRDKLELIQVALDQAAGLRDALGNPTPKEQIIHHPYLGYVPAFSIGAYNCVDLPSTHWPIIEGDDGTTAISVPEDVPVVAKNLGKTIRGVAIPRERDLVKVDSPKDRTKLPAGIMRKLDVESLKTLEIDDPTVVDDASKLDIDKRIELLSAVGEYGPARVKAALQTMKDEKEAEKLDDLVSGRLKSQRVK